MTMGNEENAIAVLPPQDLVVHQLTTEHSPQRMLDHQANISKALTDVIANQKAKDKTGSNAFLAKISGKDYLTFESWQLIARFNQCHVELENEILPIYGADGQIVAYGAYVIVIDDYTGTRRARAYAECGLTSFVTQGKVNHDKVRAAQSAAQTWAGSKACRMVFSYVAVLAGYEATTSEEMYIPLDYKPAEQISSASGVPIAASVSTPATEGGNDIDCIKHPGHTFFKSPKMKSWAHKYEDTWCNFAPSFYNEIVQGLCETLEWEASGVTELSQKLFGVSWSRLQPAETVALVAHLTELAEMPAPAEANIDAE